jgi:putative DNA primase/helicase
MNAIFQAALRYAAKGLPVFPCSPKDKRPLTEHGFRDASTNRDTIKAQWGRWPDALIGVPTGDFSGIFALDVDVDHKEGENGLESLAALEEKHSPLPDTKRTRTPSGGVHYLFRYPEGVQPGSSAGKLGPGLDTRGSGGYVIFPPSRTPKGQYVFENPQTPLADLPDWLLRLVAPPPRQDTPKASSPVQSSGDHPYVRAAVDGELEALAAARPGTRNDSLNRAAFALGG